MSDAPLPASPPTGPPHLEWCDPVECGAAEGGPHRSRSRVVPVVGGRLVGWLVSAPDDPGGPRVVVVADGVVAASAVTATPGEVREFARLVCELADRAEGRRQNGGRF